MPEHFSSCKYVWNLENKNEKKKGEKKPRRRKYVSKREEAHTQRDVRASLRLLLALFALVSSIPEEQDAFS